MAWLGIIVTIYIYMYMFMHAHFCIWALLKITGSSPNLPISGL